MDFLKAFTRKLENWKRKVKIKNVAMFEKLIKSYSWWWKTSASTICKNEILQLSVKKVPYFCQGEFLEFKTDSGARDMFNEKSITGFWPLMCNSCPNWQKELSMHCFHMGWHIFMSQAFQLLLQMKRKHWNRLEVENDMCSALSCIPPLIQELAKKNNHRFLIDCNLHQNKMNYSTLAFYWTFYLLHHNTLTFH